MGVNTSGLQNTANNLQGQQTAMFNQVLAQLGGGYGGIANALSSLLPGIGNVMGNIVSGPGGMTPDLMQQYMQLGASPQALAQFTGINAPGMVANATNYMSAPGQTNLAQFVPGAQAQLAPGQSALNMAGPQAMNVYRGMTQGLNPQFMQNAQNQLTQQFGQSVSDILSRAAPGQNTQAGILSAQDQLLGAGANLGGQLAGQSQQVAAQGAGGLLGAGQAIDQNTLQRLMSGFQMAGGLDQQKLAMLTGAAQMGTGYNQQALGNIGQGAQMGMAGLNAAQGLGQLGVGMNQYGMNMLSGMGSTYGAEAQNYTDLAAQIAATQPNPWTIGSSLLGSAAGMYMGGGFNPMGSGLMPGKGGGGTGGTSMMGGMNPYDSSSNTPVI